MWILNMFKHVINDSVFEECATENHIIETVPKFLKNANEIRSHSLKDRGPTVEPPYHFSFLSKTISRV
jgi:hypothetical protein